MRKRIVELQKFGSFSTAILRRLKVPHLSVQTKIRNFKKHRIVQPSHHSGKRLVLSPREESPWTSRINLVKMLPEIVETVSQPTVKPLHMNLKLPLLQNYHKKVRQHGDKNYNFWKHVLDCRKNKKKNCLTMMINGIFRGKRENICSLRTASQL